VARLPFSPSRFWCLLVLLPAVAAVGSEVVDVRADKTMVISQRSTGSWNLDDYVCVFHERDEVACGPVTEVTVDTATVKLKLQKAAIVPGDLVELSAEAVARGTISEEQAMATQPLPQNVTLVHNYVHNFSFGLEAGAGFEFPYLAYHMALDRRTCVTFKGGYWSATPASTVDQTGGGAMVGISYYREKCFVGFWGSLEGGAYLTKVNNGKVTNDANSLTAGVLVGYEAAVSQKVTLNLIAGARYITEPDTGPVAVTLNTFVFFGGISLGANF
jgi:hypothetical protein